VKRLNARLLGLRVDRQVVRQSLEQKPSDKGLQRQLRAIEKEMLRTEKEIERRFLEAA
jgi:hypothetical protein